MKIVKMHGLGNDFVLIDGRGKEGRDYTSLAKKICARRIGVGADGLVIIEKSDCADIRMRIINSDGSEAEMCGNASRCFAKYIYEKGIVQKEDIEVETLSGIIRPKLLLQNGIVEKVRVDMGEPVLDREKIPMKGSGDAWDEVITAAGQEVRISSLLMGVPHTVVLCEDIDAVDFNTLGPAIESHEIFPKKTNVNFVSVVDEHTARVKTWERGAGPTLACGTGSCATAVVLCHKGLIKDFVTICLAVGELIIEYREGGRVYMTGPAEYVFEGELL